MVAASVIIGTFQAVIIPRAIAAARANKATEFDNNVIKGMYINLCTQSAIFSITQYNKDPTVSNAFKIILLKSTCIPLNKLKIPLKDPNNLFILRRTFCR